MEGDEMIGALLHPIVRDRREVDRFAVELQRREIADFGEAAGVLLGERRERLALDEVARLGEPLRREGRIHFIENPIMDQ